MRVTDVPNTHFVTFESIYELVDDCTKFVPDLNKEILAGKNRGSGGLFSSVFGNHDTTKWVGRDFKNKWDNVVNAANSPWKEGMEVYDRVSEFLRGATLPKPLSLKRNTRWSEDDGEDMDVEKLQKGQAFWRETYRDQRPGPLGVTLVANVSSSAIYTSEQIMWRGMACILLMEILERSGYRVEMWAGDLSTHVHTMDAKKDHFTAVCLKRGGDNIDISGVVNATSGWFFRTIFFGAEHISDKSNLYTSDGYGRAGAIGTMLQYITEDKRVIVAEGIYDEAAAIEWITESINNLQ